MYGKEMKKLTFGLDFDDTVTKNVDMFKDIVDVILKHGGDIYITTARSNNGWCRELREFHNDTGVSVIFTGSKAKQDVAEIDIWIDDFPLAITHDFKEFGWRPSESIENDIIWMLTVQILQKTHNTPNKIKYDI